MLAYELLMQNCEGMGCLQAQRTRRNPRKNIWEELDQERLVKDTPDIEAILQQRAEVSVIQCFPWLSPEDHPPTRCL